MDPGSEAEGPVVDEDTPQEPTSSSGGPIVSDMLGGPPHPVIVTIRDNRGYIRVLRVGGPPNGDALPKSRRIPMPQPAKQPVRPVWAATPDGLRTFDFFRLQPLARRLRSHALGKFWIISMVFGFMACYLGGFCSMRD